MFDVMQKKPCLFMELNAFSTSTSKTASVLFVPNMSCIEFMRPHILHLAQHIAVNFQLPLLPHPSLCL